MDTKNSSIIVIWEDEDNRHSFLLLLEAYGLKLLLAKDIDEDRCEITLYGHKEAVDKFREDFNEGSFLVLDNMSQSLEFDEDYEGWLNNEVWWEKQFLAHAFNEGDCIAYIPGIRDEDTETEYLGNKYFD